jgi:hypothetical protein
LLWLVPLGLVIFWPARNANAGGGDPVRPGSLYYTDTRWQCSASHAYVISTYKLSPDRLEVQIIKALVDVVENDTNVSFPFVGFTTARPEDDSSTWGAPIIIGEEDQNEGILGRVQAVGFGALWDSTGGTVADHGYVIMNNGLAIQGLWMHELGHALGALAHRYDDPGTVMVNSFANWWYDKTDQQALGGSCVR